MVDSLQFNVELGVNYVDAASQLQYDATIVNFNVMVEIFSSRDDDDGCCSQLSVAQIIFAAKTRLKERTTNNKKNQESRESLNTLTFIPTKRRPTWTK